MTTLDKLLFNKYTLLATIFFGILLLNKLPYLHFIMQDFKFFINLLCYINYFFYIKNTNSYMENFDIQLNIIRALIFIAICIGMLVENKIND